MTRTHLLHNAQLVFQVNDVATLKDNEIGQAWIHSKMVYGIVGTQELASTLSSRLKQKSIFLNIVWYRQKNCQKAHGARNEGHLVLHISIRNP